MRRWMLTFFVLLLAAPAGSQSRWPASKTYFDDGTTLERRMGDAVEVEMYDADGDGSDYETCTAKDTPAPQCKVAGEVIYRDFTDDLNAIMLDYPNSEVVVKLRAAVYTGCGCWEPGGSQDCDDPTTHDDSSDASWGYCQTDEFGTNKLWTVAVRSRKLRLIGAGTDTRHNDTDELGADPRANGRTVGTTIAIDNGNFYGDWFIDAAPTGTAQNPYFSVGMNQPTQDLTGVNHIGTTATGDGDSKGWGAFETEETLAAQVHRGSLCACNNATVGACRASNQDASSTGWVQTLSAGDRVYAMIPQSEVSTNGKPVGVALQVAGTAASDGGNCAANSREIYLGTSLDNGQGIYGLNLGYPDNTDGTGPAFVMHPNSGFWEGSLTVENLTFETQDYRDEGSGDCSDTGVWTFGSPDTDDDCDSEPMFIAYSGKAAFRDVVFKNWHSYALDGGGYTGIGPILFERVKFMYGHGEPVFDAGFNWIFNDFLISNSTFADGGSVFVFFTGFLSMHRGEVSNVQAANVFALSNTAGLNLDDIRIYSSRLGKIVDVGCGARYNTLSRFRMSGIDRYGHDHSGGGSPTNSALVFTCTSSSDPVTGNDFVDWYDTGGAHPNAQPTMGRMVSFYEDTEAAVYGNSFQLMRQDTAHAYSCVFGFAGSNGGATASQSATMQGILQQNSFIGNYTKNGKVFTHYNVSNGWCSDPGVALPAIANGAGNIEGTGPAVGDPLSMDGGVSGAAMARTIIGDIGDTATDTGTEVCASAGLSCLTSLEACVDQFDTGGPPETSGAPNGFCDADGSSVAGAEVACGSAPVGSASGYFYAVCN